jgi:tetratricopeptide (TPR) repeat protein
MKKYYLLPAILFCYHLSTAQLQKTDSLLTILQQHPAEDTQKINLLNAVANAYLATDALQALSFAEKAVALAQKLHAEKQLADAYLYEGKSYLAGLSFKESLDPLQKSYDLYLLLHNNAGLINALVALAQMHVSLSDIIASIDQYQEALNIAQHIKDTTQMAEVNNMLGTVYLGIDYSKALDYYIQALKLFEQTGNKVNVARINGNIAIVYIWMSQPAKSIASTKNAYDIFKSAGDKLDMARCLTNMGNAYRDMADYKKSIDCFQRAIQLDKQVGTSAADINLANNILNAGMTYTQRREFANALPYLKDALSRFEKSHLKGFTSTALTYLSDVYSQAPDSILRQNNIQPSQRFNKAVALQKRAIDLIQQSGNLNNESQEWQNLSTIYEKEKNYALALDAYKKYSLLKDSVFTEARQKAITRKEMQYEFDKKEAISKADEDKRHSLAVAEINRQRTIKNSIAGGTGVMVLASVMSFFFYKKRRDAEEQQKETSFQLQVADTEMKALRAQMNPHFIFNSLNSISDYITKHDTASADYYLTRFSKLMRMILENSDQKEIPLGEDLKALEIYMQLEALRLNHKFTYEISVDKEIDMENTLVPPLILQPFVENSIWHGIAQKNGSGKILIEVKKENEMINCIVEDNGVGRKIPEGENNQKKSFGMKLTKARIDIMNKIKKSKGEIGLSDLAEGTRIEVKLPLALSF